MIPNDPQVKELLPEKCKACGHNAILIKRTTWDSPVFYQCFNCHENGPVVFAKDNNEHWRPLEKKALLRWNDFNSPPQSGKLSPLDHKALQEAILPYSNSAFDIASVICNRFGGQPGISKEDHFNMVMKAKKSGFEDGLKWQKATTRPGVTEHGIWVAIRVLKSGNEDVGDEAVAKAVFDLINQHLTDGGGG